MTTKNITVKIARTKGGMRRNRADWTPLRRQLRSMRSGQSVALNLKGNKYDLRMRLAQLLKVVNGAAKAKRGKRGWLSMSWPKSQKRATVSRA